MKKDIENYIQKLKADNDKRAEMINNNYSVSSTVSKYNLTLDIIKDLEDILKKNL